MKKTACLVPYLLAVFLFGCGQSVPRKASPAKATSTALQIDSVTSLTDYRCGKQGGLKPVESSINGARAFTGCRHRFENDSVLIDGFYTDTDEVCVFPLLVYTSTAGESSAFRPDPTGAPAHYCGTLEEHRLGVRFPNLQFNALVVVEKKDRENMVDCFLRADNCPNYAYGKIPE